MGHYARIEDNIVVEVIVAEQEYIDTFLDKDSYIQTSYNTHNGVHVLGGAPLRGNYAGIGYTYDRENDVFIPPEYIQPEITLEIDTGNIA